MCGHKFSFAGDVVGTNAFALVGTRLDGAREAYHFDFLIHTSISAGTLTSRVKQGAEFLEFSEFVGVLNGLAELELLKLLGGGRWFVSKRMLTDCVKILKLHCG